MCLRMRRRLRTMAKLELNISVSEALWSEKIPDLSDISTAVFETVMKTLSPSSLVDKEGVSFNLRLANDVEIQALNLQFRQKNMPTNVLSFANIDDEAFDEVLEKSPYVELGDIIISFQTIEREAKEFEKTIASHYHHILTHGILHLLGYDHIDDEEAEEMEDLEVKILKLFDIQNPYEERL